MLLLFFFSYEATSNKPATKGPKPKEKNAFLEDTPERASTTEILEEPQTSPIPPRTTSAPVSTRLYSTIPHRTTTTRLVQETSKSPRISPNTTVQVTISTPSYSSVSTLRPSSTERAFEEISPVFAAVTSPARSSVPPPTIYTTQPVVNITVSPITADLNPRITLATVSQPRPFGFPRRTHLSSLSSQESAASEQFRTKVSNTAGNFARTTTNTPQRTRSRTRAQTNYTTRSRNDNREQIIDSKDEESETSKVTAGRRRGSNRYTPPGSKESTSPVPRLRKRVTEVPTTTESIRRRQRRPAVRTVEQEHQPQSRSYFTDNSPIVRIAQEPAYRSFPSRSSRPRYNSFNEDDAITNIRIFKTLEEKDLDKYNYISSTAKYPDDSVPSFSFIYPTTPANTYEETIQTDRTEAFVTEPSRTTTDSGVAETVFIIVPKVEETIQPDEVTERLTSAETIFTTTEGTNDIENESTTVASTLESSTQSSSTPYVRSEPPKRRKVLLRKRLLIKEMPATGEPSTTEDPHINEPLFKIKPSIKEPSVNNEKPTVKERTVKEPYNPLRRKIIRRLNRPYVYNKNSSSSTTEQTTTSAAEPTKEEKRAAFRSRYLSRTTITTTSTQSPPFDQPADNQLNRSKTLRKFDYAADALNRRYNTIRTLHPEQSTTPVRRTTTESSNSLQQNLVEHDYTSATPKSQVTRLVTSIAESGTTERQVILIKTKYSTLTAHMKVPVSVSRQERVLDKSLGRESNEIHSATTDSTVERFTLPIESEFTQGNQFTTERLPESSTIEIESVFSNLISSK